MTYSCEKYNFKTQSIKIEYITDIMIKHSQEHSKMLFLQFSYHYQQASYDLCTTGKVRRIVINQFCALLTYLADIPRSMSQAVERQTKLSTTLLTETPIFHSVLRMLVFSFREAELYDKLARFEAQAGKNWKFLFHTSWLKLFLLLHLESNSPAGFSKFRSSYFFPHTLLF